MTTSPPRSDDRDFVDFVRLVCGHVARTGPEWMDRLAQRPGSVLSGMVTGAADALLHRLNRLPLRKYHELLTLLGVQRHPPTAASVDLLFSRVGAGDDRIVIPAGTRVAAAGGSDQPDVVFVTAWSTTIEPGQAAVTVRAYHGEPVDGEMLGVATGAPGQVLRVARAPIASTDDTDDVLLGVARPDGPPDDGAASREYYGVAYELWRPVTTFAAATGAERVYLLDRATGTVSFAPVLDLRETADAQPRALAALPPAGAQIRAWYRTGGGPAGNVAAGTLTKLRDPMPGVTVTNPAPARGGRAMEDLAGALARWRNEFSTQRRAINARDVEILAIAGTAAAAGSAAVARAGAFPGGTGWPSGHPGQVYVSLVPQVAAQARPGWRLPLETITAHESAAALEAAQRYLEGLRPLGTDVVSGWARYKPVSVRGRVIVSAQDDPAAVRAHLHERLYQLISPLAAAGRNDGWPFGAPLRAADVHGVVEECAARVDELRFVVAEAPDVRVRSVRVDPSRPDVWYASSGEVLFRSTNGGAGWEAVGRFPGEEIRRVEPAPASAPASASASARPGALVVLTRTAEAQSRVYLSDDFGESWTTLGELEPAATGVAWLDRPDASVLLLSTDVGLYELSLVPGSAPAQVLVDPTDPDRGFTAVSSFVSADGVAGVAVAAQASHGVYLSVDAGRAGTYKSVGLSNVDIRALAVRVDGTAMELWVGVGMADPKKPGVGCHRARLFEGDVRWEQQSSGWTGGTCWDLAFDGPTVFAASQNGGVLRWDSGAAWRSPSVGGGLPLRDRTRFEPVETVAVGSDGRALAGANSGVYREIADERWTPVANRENPETVTIPPTWLLCSGEHDVEVVREGA